MKLHRNLFVIFVLSYASISVGDPYTEIVDALLAEEPEIALRVLQENQNLPAATNDKGETLLHLATLNPEDVQVLQSLLSLLPPNSPMINHRDRGGMTPLHWAVVNGHINAVKFFLAHGADGTLRDRNNKTPLDLAIASGQTAIKELLQARSPSAARLLCLPIF